MLLVNAASKSVAADAAGEMKSVGKKLVDAGVLGEKDAARLNELAKTAADKLKALDRDESEPILERVVESCRDLEGGNGVRQ